MRYIQHAVMGSILGMIHGVILWASQTTFSSVLVPVYSQGSINNIMSYRTAFTHAEVIYNSFLITGIVDIIIIITIISAVWWLPKLEKMCWCE